MKRTMALFAAAALLAAGSTALAKGDKAAKADKKGGAKLIFKVAPEDSEIFLDGQRKGTADKVKEVSVSPGKHIVNVKHKGDEHEDQVNVQTGKPFTFEWKFEDDRPKPVQPDEDSDKAPAPSDPTAAPGGEPQAPAPAGGEMK